MSVDGNTPLLPDDQMRELGFTDRRTTHWYYAAMIGAYESINFTIEKATGNYEELVMDEAFGQPAYYGRMVEPHRTEYRAAVEREVARMRDAGLNLVVDHTLYGFKDGEG